MFCNTMEMLQYIILPKMSHIRHIRLVILLVFLCRRQIIVTAVEPGCENCGCCVDKVCADAQVPEGWRDDVCTYGCIAGIGGNKCRNKCPVDCVTCEQYIAKNCATCETGKYITTVNRDGKYFKGCVDCPTNCATCTSDTQCDQCNGPYYNSGPYNDCSLKCPENCKTCTSTTTCQECNSPYYNEGGIADCSLSCPGNCVCSSPGVCSACQDGYFNINEDCKNACPDTCKTCTDLNNCLSCNDGYYNDCSRPCRDTCSLCTSYDVCTSCKIGFTGSNCNACLIGRYGELCDELCPDTCKNNTCIKETGYCLECTTVNIIGETCDKCIYGMWGTDCSSVCPRNCEGECVRSSGHCKSCKGNFQGDVCNECSLGYHGEMCDKVCPEQCYGSACFRSNGTCESCNGNYAGPTCEDCVDGMYGHTCDIHCPSTKCSHNICSRETGVCISCPKGLYGFHCGFSCSPGCSGNICDIEDGECRECRKPYTGDKCCLTRGHCRYCSSNTDCDTCDNGFFGEECDIPCSTVCANALQYSPCEKANGKCLECSNRFYGDYCNKTCSERCANSRCDKDNGHCTEGCVDDFKGPTCAEVDESRIIGIAVGVSTAIIIAVIIIVITAVCFIFRRWKHKNQQGKEEGEASYVNTELQSVATNPQENAQIQHEYEDLGNTNQMDTEYEEIK